MSRKKQSPQTEILIPRELDAATAPDVHAALLEHVSSDGTNADVLRIELDGEGDVWPLALQLVASAARSVPADEIVFGPAAQAALGTLATPKEKTR